MDDQPTNQPQQTNPAPKTGKMKLRAIAIVAAIAGMVFGGTIEYFVGGLLDSTGWFGPTLDTVIEQQMSNFDELRAKLDAMRQATPGSPEAAKLQTELGHLLAEQEKLAGRTHTELRNYQQEVTQLKADALKTRGSAGGADFWLKAGESVTVGDRGNVFALLNIYAGYVASNASGKPHNLKPGDFVEFKSDSTTCKVFYKLGSRRDDGRVGFDLVCEPN